MMREVTSELTEVTHTVIRVVSQLFPSDTVPAAKDVDTASLLPVWLVE